MLWFDFKKYKPKIDMFCHHKVIEAHQAREYNVMMTTSFSVDVPYKIMLSTHNNNNTSAFCLLIGEKLR